MQAHALLALADRVAELVTLVRQHLAPRPLVMHVGATPEAPVEAPAMLERLLLVDRVGDLWIGTAGSLRCVATIASGRPLAEVLDEYGPVQPLASDEFLARLT